MERINKPDRVGACVKTTDYNCKWCSTQGTVGMQNILAYNQVFDICTAEKTSLLSLTNFKCFLNGNKASGCDETKCSDYDVSQCSALPITHNSKNEITRFSTDQCGIKVCQNINNKCVKNADGDAIPDCASATNSSFCEGDYFAPNTTITATTTISANTQKNIIDTLLIQIKDKSSYKRGLFP